MTVSLYSYLYTAGCEKLAAPAYGHIVTSTGNRIDDTTTIECDDGFTLLGSTTRRCRASGQWSGVPTQCVGELVTWLEGTEPKNEL